MRSNTQSRDCIIDLTVLPPRPGSAVGETGPIGGPTLIRATVEPNPDVAASRRVDEALDPVATDEQKATITVIGDRARPSKVPASRDQDLAIPAVLAPPSIGATHNVTRTLEAEEVGAKHQGHAQTSSNTVASDRAPEPATVPSSAPRPSGRTPQPDPLHNMTSGYASLSGFMASDRIFAVFRRFDTLSIRSLLYLQDEISQLESRLNTVDQADRNQGTPIALWRLHSRRDDDNPERIALMEEIRAKLKEYRTLPTLSLCFLAELRTMLTSLVGQEKNSSTTRNYYRWARRKANMSRVFPTGLTG